jgi:peptide/nickel transport system substrate-binding protein
MKTKIFIILFLILIINTTFVFAGNYGGDLKIKVELRPFNLNPLYTANETELMISKQIFDTLVTYNNQDEIIANLADSWKINSDSNIFKFQLKKDVYFHPYKIDGEVVPLNKRKVSAKDWKWSFEYLAASENKSLKADLFNKVKGYAEYRSGQSSQISGIRVKNKYQLEIELTEAYAPFIYNLARAEAVVMPAEAVEKRDISFSVAPVGTGAFQYHNISENKVTLIRNNNYWKNNYQKEIYPYLDRIEIDFTADNNLDHNLEKYELYQLSKAEISSYQKIRDRITNYQLQNMLNKNLYFIGLNYKSEIIKNNSFNSFQKSLSSILYKDENTKEWDLKNYTLPADKSEKQSFFNYLSTNLQKNKNIDFEPISEEIVLVINDSKTSIEAAEILKQLFKAKNINLEIEKHSWAEYLNKLNTRNINGDLFIMSADYNNNFEFVYNNLYSNSDANYFTYQNKRLDNLLDYLKLVNNQQTTERAFKIIKEIIVDDNPFVFLLQGTDYFLVSDKLLNQHIFKNYNQKYNFEKLYLK